MNVSPTAVAIEFGDMVAQVVPADGMGAGHVLHCGGLGLINVPIAGPALGDAVEQARLIMLAAIAKRVDRLTLARADLGATSAKMPDEKRKTSALKASLEAPEREAILDALRKSGQSAAAAAVLLGVSRRSIYYKMRKLGITPTTEAPGAAGPEVAA